MFPGVLPVVDAHYRHVRRLSAFAILAARKAWRNTSPATVLTEWELAVVRLLPAITNLQFAAAKAGAEYGSDTLAAQRVTAAPEAVVRPEAFIGWASDGRTLKSLLEVPTFTVRKALAEELPLSEAVTRGQKTLERIVHTQIGDTARVAAGVDIATRPRVGWVRMVNPPTCSRCLVLAGRFYRWSDGFDRHPGDDCVHVATNTAAARREGLVDDPDLYFRNLAKAEQDRMLGKAGAQAVRDGADLNQVVNARRGMTAAGTTTEGSTVRGFAGGRLARAGLTTRLTPERIYREATSRADALRLLKLHGYVI